MSEQITNFFTLLVVDDESDTEFLFKYNFKDELKQQKMNLLYFSGAQDCLSLIVAKDIGKFIVVSDINMPNMDGFELCVSIRSKFPQAKIILMTAYEFESYKKISTDSGATYIMGKPVDFKILKEKIFELSRSL